MILGKFRDMWQDLGTHVQVLAGSRAGTPGPAGAFVKGQEAEARQQLFGKIAPVYDQVICCFRLCSAPDGCFQAPLLDASRADLD